jgi:hypothetical protein
MKSMIFLFCVALGTPLSSADRKHVRATGWFADESCAVGRSHSGVFTATNAECALKCVKKGAKLVFIAEKEKAIWSVPRSYMDHIGEYVEIAGALDEASGDMQIESVRTIDRVRPSCTIPRKKTLGQ